MAQHREHSQQEMKIAALLAVVRDRHRSARDKRIASGVITRMRKGVKITRPRVCEIAYCFELNHFNDEMASIERNEGIVHDPYRQGSFRF